MKELLIDMAHDYTGRMLINPHDRAEAVAMNQLQGQECEAVIRFASGATLTLEFDLPASVPAAVLPTLETLLWQTIRTIEAGVERDLPTHGHTVH